MNTPARLALTKTSTETENVAAPRGGPQPLRRGLTVPLLTHCPHATLQPRLSQGEVQEWDSKPQKPLRAILTPKPLNYRTYPVRKALRAAG